MKLEAINIQSFRSIQEVTLEDCGGFNVIVGKNNVGKSNILIAINAFFKSLNKDNYIVLNPSLNQTIDHYKNLLDVPIKITMFFQLLLAERDNLIQNIVSESPQVKNSVEGIDPELRLGVTLEVMTSPEAFAYVQRIVLCKPSFLLTPEKGAVRTILEINSEAAKELVSKAKRVQDLENEIEQIKVFVTERFRRLDEDDWKRLKSNPPNYTERFIFSLPSRMVRSLKPSSTLLTKLEELIESTESKNDCIDAISSLAESMQKEEISLRSEPILHRIDSFSGKESSVPTYALNLLKEISKMNVLYLTERREPIKKK